MSTRPIVQSNLKASDYVDPMRLTGATAPGLAQQLVTHAPDDATAEEKKTLRDVGACGHAVAAVNQARQRAAPTTVRPPLVGLWSAWTGAHAICSAKERVDPSVSDVAAQAEKIRVAVFHDGVPVTQASALAAFTASRSMLERLQSENLVGTFEHVVGADVLAHIRKATADLGRAIGAGDTKLDEPSSTALQEALAQLAHAIAMYCRSLVSKLDEHQPAAVTRFQLAVRPIDLYRAAARAGAASTTDATASSASSGAA